jgi:hypothetical protein
MRKMTRNMKANSMHKKSQITVRGVSPRLRIELTRYAKKHRTSLNKAMVALLEQTTGLTGSHRQSKQRDLSAMCGQWTDAEAKRFEKDRASFEVIDEAVWR